MVETLEEGGGGGDGGPGEEEGGGFGVAEEAGKEVG